MPDFFSVHTHALLALLAGHHKSYEQQAMTCPVAPQVVDAPAILEEPFGCKGRVTSFRVLQQLFAFGDYLSIVFDPVRSWVNDPVVNVLPRANPRELQVRTPSAG